MSRPPGPTRAPVADPDRLSGQSLDAFRDALALAVRLCETAEPWDELHARLSRRLHVPRAHVAALVAGTVAPNRGARVRYHLAWYLCLPTYALWIGRLAGPDLTLACEQAARRLGPTVYARAVADVCACVAAWARAGVGPHCASTPRQVSASAGAS